jgi:hypothetical protein
LCFKVALKCGEHAHSLNFDCSSCEPFLGFKNFSLNLPGEKVSYIELHLFGRSDAARSGTRIHEPVALAWRALSLAESCGIILAAVARGDGSEVFAYPDRVDLAPL